MTFIEVKPGDWVDSAAVDRVLLDESPKKDDGTPIRANRVRLYLSCGSVVVVDGEIEAVLETINQANMQDYVPTTIVQNISSVPLRAEEVYRQFDSGPHNSTAGHSVMTSLQRNHEKVINDVWEARRLGHTWTEIGDRLGIIREEARRRFERYV